MSGKSPDQIWEDGLDEGERRLARGLGALVATSFAGGVDIFFGIVAVCVTAGGLSATMPYEAAQVVGSLAFGIALALTILGRAELFTENFLIPVSAVYAGRAGLASLARLFAVTLVLNCVGLVLFAAIFSVSGVLDPSALDVAGKLADKQAERDSLAALGSAVAAGTLMTLFTWIVAAVESASARLLTAFLVGFVLFVPSLNHAVVGFGEFAFGGIAGTASVSGLEMLRVFALAIAGNLLGGIGLVFLTRVAQVRGEPGSRSGGAGESA